MELENETTESNEKHLVVNFLMHNNLITGYYND